jgi:sulfur carrier protein ThiS
MAGKGEISGLGGQSRLLEGGNEISITALMTLREMLGWSQKTVLFSGTTLAEFLKQFTTKDEENLYDILVQENGAVRIEYMVWLNNRPVKQENSLEVPLVSGDRVVVMPVMKFAAGG